VITTLRARRKGIDLREHPAVQEAVERSNAPALDIQVVAHKRNPYDRGTSLIMVDGVQWGMFTATFRGCHGPSYHARDNYGPVQVPKPYGWGDQTGQPMDHKFEPSSGQHERIKNIGRTEKVRVVPTREQLREEARRLIAGGFLRHPDVRRQEREAAAKAHAEVTAKFEAEQKAEWDRQIDTVLDNGDLSSAAASKGQIRFADVDELREAIRDAMKWAQHQ
jgi:hypothetical protein